MKARRDDLLAPEKELFAAFIDGPSNITSADMRRPQGFVYLLRGARGFKIGRSKTPLSRVRALRTGSSEPIKIVATIFALDYDKLEKALHAMYQKQRLRAEWFDLAPADVEFIRTLDQPKIDKLVAHRKEPNQTPEPTPTRVTAAAYAPAAPRSGVAHL